MKPLWKYFIIGMLVLVIVAGGYFGYNSYRSMKNPVLTASQAIPDNTAIFIEFTNPSQLMHRLAGDSPIWAELTNLESIQEFQHQFMTFDSLLSRNSLIKNIPALHRSVLCICNNDTGSVGTLYISELPSTAYGPTIRSFITGVNGEKSIVMQKKFMKAEILMVNIPGFRKFFNYTVYKGLFIGSFDEAFVRKSVEQIESGKPLNSDENLKKIEITAGKNVDANIYLNFPEFANLAKALTGTNSHKLADKLAGFSRWTGTDLIVKPEELFLNGYTVCSGSDDQWLDLLSQEPQSILIPEILPSEVSILVHLGLEDFKQYGSALKKYRRANGSLESVEKQMSGLNKSWKTDIEGEFYSWFGHEAARADVLKGPGENRNYIVIHASDIVKANESLLRVCNNALLAGSEKAFHQQYEDYVIKKLDIPQLFQLLFGDIFEDVNCPYFTTIRDYVVFADSPDALVQLISSFYMQKTLAENMNYKAFSNNISEKSNVFLYCNLRNSLSKITQNLNSGIAGEVSINQAALRNFEALAIQFSHVSDMFYTSMYLKYNPAYQEIIPAGWETQPGNKIIGTPFLTRNPEDRKLNIIVFDSSNYMYRLDHTGKIMWKIPLIEAPVSRVNEVNYYKDGRKQYFFNTENYFVIIDESGNNVEGYPVRLPASATNEVAVLDYENNNDYRLLIALTDNKIHNFDIHGKPVEGWNKVKSGIKVNQKIEYLVSGNKNYIVITDGNNNVTFVNRKGEEILAVKKKLNKAKNSEIYINQTNDKGIFLTTNSEGQLVYITDKGKTGTTKFGDFSENHFFLYSDINGDQSMDFIFVDGNKLTVYDRFKKIILEFELQDNAMSNPVVFKNIRNEIFLSVVTTGEKKISVFNKDGRMFTSLAINGNTPFVIGSLNNDDKTNLVTGYGNKVINYVLE
jgi:hypothetical protein